MSPPNSHTNGSTGDQDHLPHLPSVPTAPPAGGSWQFTSEQVKQFVAALEVPFSPEVIEWRVVNTAKNCSPPRGQVIPYADQRAYTDRLNLLFTPSGWTRKYSVHTSPNFERGKDKKVVAKVFVTCDLTIFGIGTHSATGEEWIDDENAGCSAEAQSFKRACACLGLGRYLYHFSGVWVDLDKRNQPKKTPALFGWATPEGWRRGERPPRHSSVGIGSGVAGTTPNARPGTSAQPDSGASLVRQIQLMQDCLGIHMYRGLLRQAKAWKPEQIKDVSVQRKTLERMQAAQRGFRRLENALEKVGEDRIADVLASLKLRSIERVADLETLHRLVVELETATFPS